ncbi:MAG: zinc ribbon domain-containing protein [Desulfovibrionaceae bacterium]|nr:zinc ribbon domain-containing protein [Desulfovibrionaceae bacterium]
MPIYEYQCGDCGQVFEEWQAGFKELRRKCPVCGGRSKRLISHTSFLLKGDGWYVTEYGKGNGRGPAGNGNGQKDAACGAAAGAKAGDSPAPAKKDAAAKAESVQPKAPSGSAD